METLLQDVLLVMAVVVPLTLFAVLLYFGLSIRKRPSKIIDAKTPDDGKHPYRLQP